MNKLQMLAIATLIILSACGSDKSNKSRTITTFFPATQFSAAGVNVFSTENADLKQYYVQDGKWVLNENIPQIQTSIKGPHYRMQYFPTANGGSPNVLLYSATSGQFQFYYLEDGVWKINPLLPGGITKFGTGKISMEFTAGNSAQSAFLFATTGKEVQVLEVKDGIWEPIDFFPSNL